MPRQAITTITNLKFEQTRQAVWDEMRLHVQTGVGFTSRDIADSTNRHRDTVRSYVKGLIAAGILIPHSVEIRRKMEAQLYTIHPDHRVSEAPRVNKQGQPVTQGQANQNMWRSMRIMKQFTAKQLAVSASTQSCLIKESTAKAYIKHLHNAGFLYVSQGNGPQPRSYILRALSNSGPKPPMVTRTHVVYDQNKKQIIHAEGFNGTGPLSEQA